jgi:hypothetical protein
MNGRALAKHTQGSWFDTQQTTPPQQKKRTCMEKMALFCICTLLSEDVMPGSAAVILLL